MDEETILLVGIDRIADAISPHIGRQRVMKLIKDHGLPAKQLENRGPWMISREALCEWLTAFSIPPERV
jgi:hypothetical protein